MQNSLSVFVLLAVSMYAGTASAQRFFTRDGKVRFFSEAKLENIEAINKSGTAVFDIASGKMEWKVLIKNFLFEKALMQEHFNENYMESTRYPAATFKGYVTNLGEVKFDTDGTYPVTVKGKMNLHNVERDAEVTGTITVAGDQLVVHSDFTIKCSDYNIKIEAQKVSNISNNIKVTVDATLAPMN